MDTAEDIYDGAAGVNGMGSRKQGLKGVSTALATIAIISVRVLGMSWMAYTVLLNAQQQAAAAGRGETAALKAKELVRVYIWLDPAKQPDGRHLNLTRITFVNELSGETLINSLLCLNRTPWGRRRYVAASTVLALLIIAGLSVGPTPASGITVQQAGPTTTITIVSWVHTQTFIIVTISYPTTFTETVTQVVTVTSSHTQPWYTTVRTTVTSTAIITDNFYVTTITTTTTGCWCMPAVIPGCNWSC